jgi:exosome complex RNA-binding protein Csl4
MTCVHNGGFGASLFCMECNKELAAVIDSPVRYGARVVIAKKQAIQRLSLSDVVSGNGAPLRFAFNVGDRTRTRVVSCQEVIDLGLNDADMFAAGWLKCANSDAWEIKLP